MPHDLDPVKAGDCIARLAGAFRLSQRMLADEVEISPVALSHIITGKARAKDQTYLTIFAAFGLDRVYEDADVALRRVLRNYAEVERGASRIRRRYRS